MLKCERMKFKLFLLLVAEVLKLCWGNNTAFVKERCLEPNVLKKSQCSVISPGVDITGLKINPCFCHNSACGHYSAERVIKNCASGFIHASRLA